MSGEPYPAIRDYALIGDSHAAALVSRAGSIDWCCMPRIDSGSCFGRLLDWEHGGFCSIEPAVNAASTFRDYLDRTLVLATTLHAPGGQARVLDCFTLVRGGRLRPERRLLRVVEGIQGHLDLRVRVAPRFDYGEVRPWIRRHGASLFSAIGGDDGLVISSQAALEQTGEHELGASFTVRAGERVHLSIVFRRPEEIDREIPERPDPDELDRRLDETVDRWRTWCGQGRFEGPEALGALRSAIVLKALTHAPTGAIAAAPTTSLPESPEGGRNWDYRYSWIRDSAFSVRSLAALGFVDAADEFRRFVMRSAAGRAEDLQVLYGVGGERRLPELTLDGLEGYRGARPVRVGNAAAGQLQLDACGELLNLAWRWHERGNSPDDDDWRFLSGLVEMAVERWEEPDAGLWEWRGEPQHFVHSKVLCWAAVDRGLRLAAECLRKAPERRWRKARDEIRAAVEEHGYDRQREIFVQAFGRRELDAALLLLPRVDFVAYDDERMVRTVNAIRESLEADGLLYRYDRDDGLAGREGAFVACSFWLVECLARQGRIDEAQEVFDRAVATANGLGLFSEEYDVEGGEMLGNFPQGLTHLSHIAAALALTDARRPPG